MNIELINGDCLQEMAKIPDGSVDMVLCDLPYGTTACKWDTVIPFAPLWAHYRRVCKRNAAIVLTASQPFTSALVMSNVREFKYDWTWRKTKVTGVLNAKHQPLRCKEDIVVFCEGVSTYNAQGLLPKGTMTKQGGNSANYGERNATEYFQEWANWPRQVIDFPSEGKTVHPTQKPVAMMEYLIRTYSNEGQTVLDNTMGSGTTGVACKNTNRNFIGIELDKAYFDIASKRIAETNDNTEPFCLK